MSEQLDPRDPIDTPTASEYEAPKIEEAITAADLEREVHYAGRINTLTG